MSKFRSKADIAAAALLFVAGFALAYHSGWRFSAFEFIDDGLIMDPALRIASGQVPFRDFGTIHGITTALAESVFVMLFGPTVRAAVLHVAVINGIAAMLAFALLRLAGLPRMAAGSFAFFTAVVFYPPQGLAFLVQHGMLAMLVALTTAFLAARPGIPHRLKPACWLFVGLALAFAFLGRQTLGLLVPALAIALAIDLRRTVLAKAALVFTGGVLPFLALFAAAGGDRPAFDHMWTYLIALPWEFGGQRLNFSLNKVLVVYELATTPTIVLAIAGVVAAFVLRRTDGSRPVDAFSIGPLRTVIIGGLLMWGNVWLARIHHWNPHMLLQLVFVASGLVAAGLYRMSAATARDPAANALGRLVLVLFLCVGALDSWWMHANLGQRRGIRNIQSTLWHRAEIDSALVYPEMRGIDFFDQRHVTIQTLVTTGDDIGRELTAQQAVITALRSLPYNVFMKGIPKHVLMFAGKIPALPVVSVQPGASSPYRDSPAFAALLVDLRRNMDRFGVGAVILGETIHRRHQAWLTSRPDVFCAIRVIADGHAVQAEFCPAPSLPGDTATVVAHVLELDGDLYR